MAALESPQQFVEMVRLSELIDDFQLQRSVQEFDHNGTERTAGELARFLVECRLLTKWQADKLQEKKYKGFFLGPYVILEYRESTAEFNRYLVRHAATGRLLIMKVFPPQRRGPEFEIEEL